MLSSTEKQNGKPIYWKFTYNGSLRAVLHVYVKRILLKNAFINVLFLLIIH